MRNKLILAALATVLCLSTLPRLFSVLPYLPDYSIDENEVVETAVLLMGGDINYGVLSYGPLMMYLLAFTFTMAAIVQSLNVDLFASMVFFEPTQHYAIARVVNGLLVYAIIAILFVQTKRLFSSSVAIVASVILALPLVEVMTGFTVRIDTLQALFQTLAFFSALHIAMDGRNRHYVLFAIFAGLAVASKPLPGLLIIPLLLASHLSYGYSRNAQGYASLGSMIRWVLLHRAHLSSYFIALTTSFLANPIALFHPIMFWRGQFRFAGTRFDRPHSPGYDLTRFSDLFGTPLAVIFALGILYTLIRGGRLGRLTVLFPSLYFIAFAPFPSRNYFYISILPMTCIATGFLATHFYERLVGQRSLLRSLVVIVLVAFAFFQPVKAGFSRFKTAHLNHQSYQEVFAPIAARTWIEKHIPSGENIVVFAKWEIGPRILSRTMQQQALTGHYFWYHRSQSDYFKRLFIFAYHKYLEDDKPAYHVRWFNDDKSLHEAFKWFLKHDTKYFVFSWSQNLDRFLEKHPDIGGVIKTIEDFQGTGIRVSILTKACYRRKTPT